MKLLFSGEKRDRKAELSDFLQRFRNGNYADVPVAEMRHIIPLLHKELHSEEYDSGKGFFRWLFETVHAVLRTV
jgi:hypothetical protein